MLSPLDQFRLAGWSDQARMLAEQPAIAHQVRQWLGPAAYDELFALHDASSHLSAGKSNLIVVPGVMGSILLSEGLGGVWWMDMLRARDQLNKLALQPDGLTDAEPGADVQARGIDLSYVPLRAAIAQSGDFGGTRQFPYDWRKPLAASASQLRDLILRTHSEFGEPVHLVGHSMGGLMIRTALRLHGAELWPVVGKIVFIATPHYGSPSIAGYLKNHLWGWEELAVVGAFLSRETFRSMWGPLSLLPAPAGIYPGTRNGEAHPCANFDCYSAEAYRLDLDAAASTRLNTALRAASEFHHDLFDWHTNQLLPEQRRRMLQISGVGRKTLFRLEVGRGWLGLWDDVDKITARTEGDPNREGDGRVPLASAELENVTHRYVEGEHGSVQNLPAVVKDTLAWIADRPLELPDSPEAALSGHLAGGSGSAAPNLDGSARLSRYDDGYDRYRDVPEARVQELVRALEAGQMPGIDLTKIL